MLRKFLAGVAAVSLAVLGVVGVSSVAYADVVNVPDKNLAECINQKLGQATGSAIDDAALAGITELECTSKGIKDLTGLEKATGLNKLKLAGNAISDVSALGSLTSLTTLWLSENQISNVSALGSLTSLNDLYLNDNQITDVSALGSLTSLTNLSLDNNQVSDVSALGSLTSLTKLSFDNNQVSDVSALGSLTSLTDLSLVNNQVSDVSALGSLTSLTNLRLNDNQITDVSALSSLTSLTDLMIKNNRISDFRPVSQVKKLYNSRQNPVVYVRLPSKGKPSTVDFVFYEADGTTSPVNLDKTTTDFGVAQSGTTFTFSCTPDQCKALVANTLYYAVEINRLGTPKSELWVSFTEPLPKPKPQPTSKSAIQHAKHGTSGHAGELAKTGSTSESLAWWALMLIFGGVTTFAIRRLA